VSRDQDWEVFVAVGTDMHPFDRLVSSVERWAVERGVHDRVLVQYGESRPPTEVAGVADMGYEEFQEAMDRSRVIVTHGGPATMADARRRGKRPIVVPRNPAFGEHVDDHQMRFSAMLAGRGVIVLCNDDLNLHEALDSAASARSADAVENIIDLRSNEAVLQIRGVLDSVLANGRRTVDVSPLRAKVPGLVTLD
jgi:UDP-N-acetylglucosamine transferase subunit ALG13